MKPVDDSRNELLQTLRRLRWLMRSFQWSGIDNWWIEPPAAAPSDTPDAKGSAETVFPEAHQEECPSGDGERARPNRAELLETVREDLGDCRRCRLHETRTNIVFGEGSPEAPLVFVGEGPGQDEDRQGRPFVGRAGKLLNKMIEAMGLRREGVYICNVVKCRPPKNRTPEKDEVAACSPFLVHQLEAIHPRIICALGAPAAQTLLDTREPISRLRGGIRYWRGIPFIATFHPAYLLRNPAQKAAVWRDLLIILEWLQTNAD